MTRYTYGVTIQMKLRRLHRTQRQLAAELGYSPSYVSLYLSGKLQNPMLRTKIQEILTQWEQEA